MNNYEILLLINPDQSDQVASMTDRYKNLITESNGSIHRFEDWGRRQLAYPINKLHKAHYILMNIACDVNTLDELGKLFRYNDAVIRNLIIKQDEAFTETSPIMKEKLEKKERNSEFKYDYRQDRRKEETVENKEVQE
jgi:small subunit ribosomal protein S6